MALSLSGNPLPSKSGPRARFASPGPVDSKANQVPSGTAISGAKSPARRTSTWPPKPPIVHPDKLPVSKPPFTIVSVSAFTSLDDASAANNDITTAIIASDDSGLLLLTTFYLFLNFLQIRVPFLHHYETCTLICTTGPSMSLFSLSQIHNNVAYCHAFCSIVTYPQPKA